ncbi:Predicted DNA-binding transcriptional regulator YafY, contains an HTH and WYL domains [Brevibacterium sandarakinum]|uniref:Predicted DNA-binding transcriptional regulator YafY, contains an HTH and WYL domains n=2 Tax=Brevibacterium sandarakinum TaxID=629680 RepID=A0A1H1UJA3_BRESA|nr:WYL domain-containing protein [Brevibacterium sandarakinum]SDS72592.1 Predicted DNA-binding transcriptional regulator YafY, contains an HTH and WYL domains [Brevibacterium sandarakinum]
MSQTAGRLLGLLSLLMVPRTWSGTELAERLNVSSRTVRNDIGTLRDLGYPVEGTRGGEGGYRLGSGGSAVPPLLLNPDEAVAVAVGLHSGLSCIIGGMEETSAQALAKLEQILPASVRNRVKNLAHFTVPMAGNHPMPIVDPNLLTLIIEYCHGHQRFRFSYRAEALPDHGGAHPDPGSAPSDQGHSGEFEVEPYRLVNHQHRWYLLTFDTAEDAWAIFRVEHIVPKLPGGRRFEPRELPAKDIGAYVDRNVSARRWKCTATVTVQAAASEVMTMLMPAEGTVEALDELRSTVVIGAESVRTMALTLARLDVEFTVEDSPELNAEIRALSERLLRATPPSEPTATSSETATSV